MPSRAITDLLRPLPWALRFDIEGYLASVEAARADIYEEANVEREGVPIDALLIVAAAWRIWMKLDSQYWIVHNTLAVGETHGFTAIRTGPTTYAHGSDEVVDLRRFRLEMWEWLRRNDLQFVTNARGVVPLLRMLDQAGADGGQR